MAKWFGKCQPPTPPIFRSFASRKYLKLFRFGYIIVLRLVFLTSCLQVFLIGKVSAQENHDYTQYFDAAYYLKKGFKEYIERDFDSVEWCIDQINPVFEQSFPDSSLYYRIELLKAGLLARQSQPAQAIDKLYPALGYFEQHNDSIFIARTLVTLGVANYYLNRRTMARTFLQQSLPYKRVLSLKEITRIYQDIGSINLEEAIQDNDDSLIVEAADNYRKAIKLYRQQNNLNEQALATSLLAECYFQLHKKEKAVSKIDEAISLATTSGNNSQQGFALIKKANFLAAAGREIQALKILQQAKNILNKERDKSTYLYALREEKSILEKLNRYKEANQIGNDIIALNAQMYKARFADKVTEMDAKYKLVSKENEIARQKANLARESLKVKQRNFYLVLLLLLLLLIAIVGIGLYKKQKFEQQKLIEENRLKDEIARKTIENKLQEERLRIARDLHDNIGAQLTFIISSIDNAKYIINSNDTKLTERFSHISDFARNAMTQLRGTIWVLNKPEISIRDLENRILNFIEKAKISDMQVAFKYKINNTNNYKLTMNQGISIFRILQEAVSNAIKHASASSIVLSVFEKREQVIFSLIDNGHGFLIEEVTLGEGLKNMKERAKSIDANLEIISSPEKGTQLILGIPVSLMRKIRQMTN